MTARVSHSLLDPWVTVPLKSRYDSLRIPQSLPPEGIVLIGHLSAIAGAVGLAFCTTTWWGGLLAAAGIVGNHVADVFDGTHARRTGQCRNGGELLDHFLDPLSFSYWLVGLVLATGQLGMGLAAVICLYATAVLTNIRAKLIGEFTLAAFGPTEFKALLAAFGLAMAGLSRWSPWVVATTSLMFFTLLLAAGIVQLIVNLVRAVRDVNRHGRPADTSEWVMTHDPAEPADTPPMPVVADRHQGRVQHVGRNGVAPPGPTTHVAGRLPG